MLVVTIFTLQKGVSAMTGLIALLMLGAYGLAICMIGGMLASGVSASLAMVSAAFVVVVTTVLARTLYHSSK